MPFRIVQWTTGNVGRRSVRAVVANPEMALVGCYAWAPDKVGRDIGELCDIGPIGVTATDDIDALLGLRPDCVVYNPKWPDVDHLVRILESGANVVTTAGFITGHSLGRERILAACDRGRSSIFGSGMNPGFANLLAMVSAQICDRVDSVRVLESVDSTGYDSADTERSVGYGLPIDDPGLPAMTESGTAVFGDAVRLMADAFGWVLDDVRCVSEYARTTERLEMASWSIEPGCVAGIGASWQGIRGGAPVIELNVRWRKGRTLDPDWPIEHGYLIEVRGQPCVRTKLEVSPPADFKARSFEDFMVLGMIMTALPAVDAIARVCAAPPGIVTYTDLPLPLPRL